MSVPYHVPRGEEKRALATDKDTLIIFNFKYKSAPGVAALRTFFYIAVTYASVIIFRGQCKN